MLDYTIMNDFIRNIKRRYSCKSFDTTKSVSQQDIDEIIEIFRYAPSMLNIQPWKLFIVQDSEKKLQLQSYSADQKQVGTSSHVLVFARKQNIDNEHIWVVTAGLKNQQFATQTIADFMNSMSIIQQEHWAFSQVSLALWMVISFLAYKWIDSCPIGILDRKQYDDFLWIGTKWYHSVFALVIGYTKKKPLIQIKHRLTTPHIVEYL